jgi:hypothetical protein
MVREDRSVKSGIYRAERIYAETIPNVFDYSYTFLLSGIAQAIPSR